MGTSCSLHRRPDYRFDPGRQTKSDGITRSGDGVTAVFRIIKMVLADQFEESPWFEIDLGHRPSELATRFIAPTNWASTYLMVLARRKIAKPIFADPPQQMSYESMWFDPNKGAQIQKKTGRTKGLVAKVVTYLKKGAFVTVYRQCRVIFRSSKLPDYYRRIPSKVWMKY